MTPAVVFDDVSKKFRRGERHDSLRDLVPALFSRAWRRRRADALGDQEFWAVRDVSFAVSSGEGLAIIGPNGAGKSTILKLLSRILKPTRGACAVHGRVGALIEVAAGFHPDLTGRENVFLQGAIMGMTRPEIVRRFDEIVEFASLEQFVDTPVKRYSSGMNARLGFSIAAHLNPDVLIIDEILSVGDMQFQQKCIDRLISFKSQGAAIVFVSHNLQAVASYFDRGLLMDQGHCRCIGSASEAVAAYASAAAGRKTVASHARAGIVSVSLRDRNDAVVSEAAPGDELSLIVTYRFSGDRTHNLIFGMYVTDSGMGTRLYNASAGDLGLRWTPPPGPGQVTIKFRFRVNLLRGAYHINAHVSDPLIHECLDRREPAAYVTVHEDFSVQGSTNLDVRCTVLASEPGSSDIDEPVTVGDTREAHD
ncbi:MAG TPA: ABC transporter ATP-binding protein [Vicinamibacterales bacterium]|nr:ABC transporter ATP-binding protein [Vicinamibacterales bacterium]